MAVEGQSEDLLAVQMAIERGESGITYVAFTATPKAKTLELFGRRLDPPRLPASDMNRPVASTSLPCGRPSRRASSSTC